MDNYVDNMIQDKLNKISSSQNINETGRVTKIHDYIVEVTGLENVRFFEKVKIDNKAIGYVNYIGENSIVIAILEEKEPIVLDDIAYSTGEKCQAYFSTGAIGRIIDMFGEDKLTGKKFENLFALNIENATLPIMKRGKVHTPLYTGISGIDLIYPIGKGQRQLIIGDKKTGKTQICLDTIVNQKGKNILCIYIGIGKTKKEIKNIYYELSKKGAMQYTIILTAFNDEKPPVLSLTPYVGLSIAECYAQQKNDVLVVIDDLKRHAEVYREISLLVGKTPGRDAYPADIFYTHSRLLEKGCQIENGGSITILPIVETKGGDITDYISTNIISITDGQIVLSEKNFQKGEKPAINYGLSVSRLGGAVQEENIKKLGSKVRRELLSYIETRDIYELANFDDMSPELKNKIRTGKEIIENLKQYKYSPRDVKETEERFKFINES